jgi:hypothetical protein
LTIGQGAFDTRPADTRTQPMIEATQDRLDEARFFLDKLRERKKRQQQLFQTEPKEFRYNVHAFLSAARGVRWTLQKEEPEKYKAWTDTWSAKDTDADKQLLQLMNEQRIAVIHRKGAETTPVAEKVTIREGEHPVYGVHYFAPPGTDPPWTILDIHHFEYNGKKEEVVATCERYVDYLDRMLKDFIAAHIQPGASALPFTLKT